MSAEPIFFKLHSQLGIRTVSFGGDGTSNSGVKFGAHTVLGNDKVPARAPQTELFPSPAPLTQYEFPDARIYREELPKSHGLGRKRRIDKYLDKVAEHSKEVKELIVKTVGDQETHYGGPLTVVAIGGDHSIGFPVLAAMLERHDVDKTAVVSFDSHFDVCTRENSPSGNFHGQWLTPFLVNDFGHEGIDALVPEILPGKNLIYVGNLRGEPHYTPAEESLLVEQGVEVYGKEVLEHNMPAVQAYLAQKLTGYDHVHVTFDIDVFHGANAPGTGIAGDWGLTPKHIAPVLETIAQSAKTLSLTLAEVNPEKDDAFGSTLFYAQQVIETLLYTETTE